METGTKISLGLHGIVLGLAAFGGPLFDSDESEAIQISDVSIITTAEFDSMMSNAPSPDISEPSVMEPVATPEPEELPKVEQPIVEAPESEPQTPTVEPEAPELPQIAEPAEPLPEVVVESPEVAEVQQEATGSAVVVPDAQVSDQDVSGQVSPEKLALLRPRLRPAPRISDEVNEKPATDAEPSTEKTESTSTDAEATKQTEAKEEAAPEESTTEIVTEIEQDPNSAAPVKSARPKGRPADLVARAKAAKEQATKAKAAKEADAKAIEAALKAATQESATPSGPPMTGREREALIFAVTQCWNPPTGVINAGNLKVTLLIDLDKSGKLRGTPKLIDPSGSPKGMIKQAYEAGKRALIRCAPYNGLPKEKYEHWRQIEVVFNPKNMAVK